MVEEKSRIFLELREKKEKQLVGLRAKFKQSFEQYRASPKSEGQYPDLNTSTEVDVYIGSRRDLWDYIQKLDMVLRDVTSIALEILREMKTKQKNEVEGK
jgi:hypothetical protein